jgi:hypothetical protein
MVCNPLIFIFKNYIYFDIIIKKTSIIHFPKFPEEDLPEIFIYSQNNIIAVVR